MLLINSRLKIVDPSEDLRPGTIWDSNRTVIISCLKERHFNVLDFGIVRDNEDALIKAFNQVLSEADVIISTGGVSMGDKDLVKHVIIKHLNGSIHFGRVNMKPGKPMTFATCYYNERKKVIFALPGNPVSAYVTAILFVIPALRSMCGQKLQVSGETTLMNIHQTVEVNLEINKPIKLDSRPEFKRASLNFGSKVTASLIQGNQRSSRFMSVKGADCLVLIPASKDGDEMITSQTAINAIIL